MTDTPMTPALPLTVPFILRVTMTSDWHVGQGAGQPGHIDRLIQRDADGLPFVPAKTLTGIWRDAAERLTEALDEGSGERKWRGWLVVQRNEKLIERNGTLLSILVRSYDE